MRFFAFVFAFAVWAAGASAQAADTAENEAGQIRLIAADTALGGQNNVRLGLHFALKDEWKIYWRTPGDAGYPPKLDWTGSDNAGEAAILWPAPKRFVLAGLQNHGYKHEAVLPLDMPVPDPSRDAHYQVKVDYLACAQICVPMLAELSLDLPAGTAAPSPDAHLISRYAALVPGTPERAGIRIEALEATPGKDGPALRVRASSDLPFGQPDLFVEPAELGAFDQPSVQLSADRKSLTITAPAVPGTLNRGLTEGPVVVVLTDGERSLEYSAVPTAGAAAAPAGVSGGLAAILGIALLGGLILNLMPCVLPVLSIKILGALGHGGAELRHIRAAFTASAAGIVVSFWVLAGAAVALKTAGAAIGWGIQFQQPIFLAVMIALLLSFALNLWGLFEIRLPSALMNAGPNGAHHTLLGHFLSGAFATLLATPCSAPFLGTAVGFALARGPGEIFAVFTMLGLGMALPFLAAALWPRAAQMLPKPGPWMVTVKKVMALALAATALWLAAVMAAALTPDAPQAASKDGAAITWQSWSDGAPQQLAAQGKVVFVDVTADWCITCKVNKAAVVERGEVARVLGSGHVVAMRADWTKPDDGIARYLASFGRYGIPFNAVYGPKAPQGIALPELLSTDEVLAAVKQAGG